MPELPEVTTTVKGINKECTGYTITDVWTDFAVQSPSRIDFYETIKYLPYFKKFKKKIIGQQITGAERRGKNILINLSDGKTIILVHMKMTGHMMVGQYDYNKKSNSWHVHKDETNQALHDPYNRFVHVVFKLTPLITKSETPQHREDGRALDFIFNTKHLVLCDSRKFAKVTLLENEDNHKKHLGGHGPEPVNLNGTYEINFTDFENALDTAPANNRPIKSFIMDTRTIAGVGNIYSDEMLFLASVHPKSVWSKIPTNVRKLMHKSMLQVLKKGIDFGGDSMSDYRNIYGQRGEFQNKHNVYQKRGEKCTFGKGSNTCTGTIHREFIGGRSAHFCPVHQKLYK